MKIFVSCLAFDEGKSGISDYILSTTRVMLKEHDVWVLIHRTEKERFPLSHPRLHFVYAPNWTQKPIFSMLWHLFLLPLFLNLWRYDLVFLPAGNRRLLARYPDKAVVTFHDLSQYHVPEKYDPLRMLYIKQIVPHYLKKAPHIFAISENTKNDLIRHYGLSPYRIKVNYNGYNPAKLENPASLEELRELVGISKPFMLYIARLEHPGKNHVNLLKAYDLLPPELQESYDLVCAGSPWNGSPQVFAAHKKLKHPSHVHFPGFVSDSVMAGLYRHASLYVFPSLYEGFGIPVLEAFASGVPVICSDRSSLPEIGGTAVLTFNPEDPASISKRIGELLTNPTLQAEMVKRGRERLKHFSWDAHVRKIIRAVSS